MLIENRILNLGMYIMATRHQLEHDQTHHIRLI